MKLMLTIFIIATALGCKHLSTGCLKLCNTINNTGTTETEEPETYGN